MQGGKGGVWGRLRDFLCVLGVSTNHFYFIYFSPVFKEYQFLKERTITSY